jgi:hypothetical protein
LNAAFTTTLIPNSVTYIGDSAFRNDSGLASSNVNTISYQSTGNLTNFGTFTISDAAAVIDING